MVLSLFFGGSGIIVVFAARRLYDLCLFVKNHDTKRPCRYGRHGVGLTLAVLLFLFVANVYDLHALHRRGTLLPWGEKVPDYCRIPVKASNNKPEMPMYSSKKGPLHNALQKLRLRYAVKESL